MDGGKLRDFAGHDTNPERVCFYERLY